MSATERAWRKEFAAYDAAVRPHVRCIGVFPYIEGTCPAKIVRHYAAMCSLGYANGWLTRWGDEDEIFTLHQEVES